MVPLTFDCSSCEVGSRCECNLAAACSEGVWRIKNKEGTTPLPAEISSIIPPLNVTFYPTSTGKINATVSCYLPIPTRYNSTTVNVTEKLLTCPSECYKDAECKCTVKGCNSGLFIARQDSATIKSIAITGSPLECPFTPTKIGTVEAVVACENPLRPLVKTTIIVTTSISGAFVGSNFRCVSAAAGYRCSLDYNNNYGVAFLVFFFSRPSGEMIYYNDIPITVGLGSGTKDIDFSCSNRIGKYFVSWTAFANSDLTNPIPGAWPKPEERKDITC
jgi:hypothetical protein